MLKGIYIGDIEGRSHYVLDDHQVGVRLPDGTYKIVGTTEEFRGAIAYAMNQIEKWYKEDGEIQPLAALTILREEINQ